MLLCYLLCYRMPAYDDPTTGIASPTLSPPPFQTTPIVPQPIDTKSHTPAWDADFVKNVPATNKTLRKSTSNGTLKSPTTTTFNPTLTSMPSMASQRQTTGAATTTTTNPAWALSPTTAPKDPFADLHIEKKSLLHSSAPMGQMKSSGGSVGGGHAESLMLMQPTVNTSSLANRTSASGGSLSAQDILDFLS